MLANELLIKTRKFAKDLSKTIYDDYEVFEAVNDAIRLLAEVSAQGGLCYFRTNTLLSPGDFVPIGFIKDSHCFNSEGVELFRVMNDNPQAGEYAIIGDKFETGATEGTFKLMYFYVPNKISRTTDIINLPETMAVPISKTAAYILQNDDGNSIDTAKYFMGSSKTSESK